MSEGGKDFGYNAAIGEFGSMIEMGILDPTKVTRSALQNAASISGMLITTACMSQMKKEVAAAAGGAAGMGGMGGMGGTCGMGMM